MQPTTVDLFDTRIVCAKGWDLVIFDWFVLSMRMQVILDSLFARSGSAPIWGGKKGEFRDWTNQISGIYLSWGVQSQADTCRRSAITTTFFIWCPVHLVSLRDKHWRPILDTTPLNARLRASKFVYLQL